MNIGELESVKYVDKKLIRRIKILIIILVIMSGALTYEIFLSKINILWVLIGVLFGVGVGALAGRMFSIEWHKGESKVIGRLDVVGGIVLVLYISFSIARSWIFEHWFKGLALSAFTFSFAEGAMLGRILNMRFSINKVLTEQGKI